MKERVGEQVPTAGLSRFVKDGTGRTVAQAILGEPQIVGYHRGSEMPFGIDDATNGTGHDGFCAHLLKCEKIRPMGNLMREVSVCGTVSWKNDYGIPVDVTGEKMCCSKSCGMVSLGEALHLVKAGASDKCDHNSAG